MLEEKTMNAEGQHERQQQQQQPHKIAQAKCQRLALEQRTCTLTITGNALSDEHASRHVVETRRIKKERHFVDPSNENGTTSGVSNDRTTGSTENGHSRANNLAKNTTNGFYSSDILQEIIAAKFGQASNGNAAKNDKIRLMIEDSLSEDSKNHVQEIFLQVEQLKIEEKLLLYLRLPASLANPGGIVDPLRQPLNPLGNRYEIHQTIMWIKTHLEEDPDVSLPKQEVYDEYNVFCIRNAMKPLSTADFGKVMKQVYPRVRPRRLGTRGNSRYCYAGMRKRVKLDTPTLPTVTDATSPDEFDESVTEQMLGAASTLIREWAESLLKMKFSSLSALARYLVDNLRVDTRSLAAVCILCASGDSPASSNNKVSETSPGLSVTPVAGKPGKLREAQLQLQRKLQQREHTRDQKNRQSDGTLQNSSKDKIIENSVTTAGTTTTPTTTTTRSSSSIGKGSKKSKTNQAQAPSTGGASSNAGASPKCWSQPVAGSSPATRNRKLPRSVSQASNNNTTPVSPQLLNCDNEQSPSVATWSQQPNDDSQNGVSRSCTPYDARSATKNSRKRLSLEQTRQTSESSPEKQAKLEENLVTDVLAQRKPEDIVKLPAIQRLIDKAASIKAEKSETVEKNTETTKRRGSRDVESSIIEKMTNGRAAVWESLAVNRLEDKLCTIDPDALDDYLNGGNNSQEQEEELLQYFQQSNSSNSDLDSVNPTGERASRSDKVSQLRLILQQNLRAVKPSGNNNVETAGVCSSVVRRTTPVPESKLREETIAKHHDIVLPILLNHHPVTNTGTRRRVSFETSVLEQQQNQQESAHVAATPVIPQSPNTRRRIFNFTPISPGPHSPINGRAASKSNSENASPFVSPRNTPVPRSRSNLQSAGGCRARSSQKSLARSISCSVPYIGSSSSSTKNDTFVVPTSSSSDNSRLLAIGQASLPRGDVLASGIHGGRLCTEEETQKILNENRAAAAAAAAASTSFLADIDQQKQLLINYPSQENLQEIKNVYGGLTKLSRTCQPADQEISELLNGVTKQQSFEQLFYRSQSVPLHRMVNPTLMSPIASQFIGNLSSSFNTSSSSSIAPTPVPSEFNDFVSIGAPHDAYLLDDVDTGFIADDQQFLMEDKESITKILNILDEEGRQSLTVMPDGRHSGDLLESTNLPIDLLDPLPNSKINAETIIDPASVLDPSVDPNLCKIIESRSYPNTPLPIVTAAAAYTGYNNEDTNNPVASSRSYPSTPLQTLQSHEIYRETNEPMLSSPTLNSLNLRGDNVESSDNVCRNVTDLLETNYLGDPEPDNDDLDPLGNFDGLQDVDSLTPLFNEVTDANR